MNANKHSSASAYGPIPEMDWLPVNDLVVDSEYQRDANSKKSLALIRRLAEGFSWRRFQPLTVALRADAKWAVVDGQHRLAAARLIGLDRLPCYIVDAEAVSVQAESFVAVNRNRVNVNVWQLHYANLAAGEPEALRIAEACREAGITISRYPRPADEIPPGETMAVRTIAKLLDQFGDAPVVDALKALAEAFPDVGGQIRSTAVQALVHFFLLHKTVELDWPRLIATTRDQDMATFEEAARASRALFGGKTHIAMSMALTRAYNRGLRDASKRLPEALS
jgi:ParB-like nuclease domain